jgi:hypothetical protein
MKTPQPTEADIKLASKFRDDRWQAAGSLGVHGSAAARLCRLGLLYRKQAPSGLSAFWHYKRKNRITCESTKKP